MPEMAVLTVPTRSDARDHAGFVHQQLVLLHGLDRPSAQRRQTRFRIDVQADLATVLNVAVDVVQSELDDHRRLAIAVQAHAAAVVHPRRST
jgi:hypothetical protein